MCAKGAAPAFVITMMLAACSSDEKTVPLGGDQTAAASSDSTAGNTDDSTTQSTSGSSADTASEASPGTTSVTTAGDTTASSSATDPATTSTELTAQEALAISPPPPDKVRIASVSNVAVNVAWNLAPDVTVPHSYSDKVIGYRVYRQGASDPDPIPIALSEDLSFSDADIEPGASYEYSVSSVRDGNIEGGRSEVVTAKVP